MSKKLESDHYTPLMSRQADPQKSLFKEIRDRAWEFDVKKAVVHLAATGKGPTEILADCPQIIKGELAQLARGRRRAELVFSSCGVPEQLRRCA